MIRIPGPRTVAAPYCRRANGRWHSTAAASRRRVVAKTGTEDRDLRPLRGRYCCARLRRGRRGTDLALLRARRPARDQRDTGSRPDRRPHRLVPLRPDFSERRDLRAGRTAPPHDPRQLASGSLSAHSAASRRSRLQVGSIAGNRSCCQPVQPPRKPLELRQQLVCDRRQGRNRLDPGRCTNARQPPTGGARATRSTRRARNTRRWALGTTREERLACRTRRHRRATRDAPHAVARRRRRLAHPTARDADGQRRDRSTRWPRPAAGRTASSRATHGGSRARDVP